MLNRLSCVVVAALLTCSAADSAEVQTQFNVTMTITKACSVSSGGALAFGSTSGFAATGAESTTTLTVSCTKDTGYEIGLDLGSNAGTGTTRYMANGTNKISYELYQDEARQTVWGNTTGVGGTTKRGQTGTGTAQTHTVYGKVLTQSLAPAEGSYQDTVMVTITY